MQSFHLLLGLPLFLFPTSIAKTLHPKYLFSRLTTWPNYLNLPSLIFTPSCPTFNLLLTSSFFTLSSLVIPYSNLSILISATSNFFSILCITTRVSMLYIIAGLTTTLCSLPFTLRDTFCTDPHTLLPWPVPLYLWLSCLLSCTSRCSPASFLHLSASSFPSSLAPLSAPHHTTTSIFSFPFPDISPSTALTILLTVLLPSLPALHTFSFRLLLHLQHKFLPKLWIFQLPPPCLFYFPFLSSPDHSNFGPANH